MCECYGPIRAIELLPREMSLTHDASIRHESEEVQSAIAFLRALACFLYVLLLVEFLLLDGLVDTYYLHVSVSALCHDP